MEEQFKEGDRIELHPATDRWMRGDRFGEILSIGTKYVHIRMDRSGSVLAMLPENVRLVDGDYR